MNSTGPGSVIGLGSSSGGEDSSHSGTKRPYEDDSEDSNGDMSRSGGGGSRRGESPSSRVDAVGMARKKQTGRPQKKSRRTASQSDEGKQYAHINKLDDNWAALDQFIRQSTTTVKKN
jgi:hypothetical protein